MIVLLRVEREMGDLGNFLSMLCKRGSYWMKFGWMLKIELEKRCNLKRVWNLVGLMMLRMMIVDKWLGFEGAVIVVGVL